MVSGEDDYTQRTRILQHVTADIHALIEGVIDGAILNEEGTETSAATYAAWQGMVEADDAVLFSTGVNSLELTLSAVDQDCASYRWLGTMFTWANFVSLTVETYRTAGQFANAGEGIWILLQKTEIGDVVTYAGMRAFIDVSADASGVWVTHTLNKGDFVNWLGGLNASDIVMIQTWYAEKEEATPSDYINLDNCDIVAGSPTTTPFLVDADGHLQIDALSIAAGANNIGDVDVLSLPSTPAGTNAIGSVEVTDISEIGDFYSANVVANGETILVSPGAAEKVKVSYFSVSCYTDDTVVEIREQDNDTNRVFYAKMKEGAAFNANLIGHEYITSTVNKDLEINTNQVCDLYVVIGYELV